MRHRIAGYQLNRTAEHRTAMVRNMAAALFEHGEIETTMPKAKAVQPFVERLITIAKHGGHHARRRLEAKINDRMIFAWVADPNTPEAKLSNRYFDLPDADDIKFNRYGELKKAPRLVQHILTTIAPMYADRDGGYTRIIKLGRNRLGDAADIVLLQLVGEEEGPELGGGVSRRREKANNRTAYAAKLRKGAGDDKKSQAKSDSATAVAEPPEEEAPETPAAEAVTEDTTAQAQAAPADESAEDKKND